MSQCFIMTNKSIYHGAACQAVKERIIFLRQHLALTEREYRDLRELLKKTVSNNMRFPDRVSTVHVKALQFNIYSLKRILKETAYEIAVQRDKYNILFNWLHHILNKEHPPVLSQHIAYKHRKNHGMMTEEDMEVEKTAKTIKGISEMVAGKVSEFGL